jgi:hypothetical protein
VLNTALVLFVVAALFGLYMASRVFRGSLPPWGAVIGHGLFAAAGLVVILYAILAGATGTALYVGAVLLVIAALGGFLMLSFHMRKQPPPKAVVGIHALAAVIGVATLLGVAIGVI